MKNCNEMVNSLLERREQYIEEQKRKRTIIIRTASTACCVCLVALSVFRVFQSNVGNTPPDRPIASDVNTDPVNTSVEGQDSRTNEPTISENTKVPVTNNKIRIQKIEDLPGNSSSMLFDLMVDDFIPMIRDEINEYYGTNISRQYRVISKRRSKLSAFTKEKVLENCIGTVTQSAIQMRIFQDMFV